MGTLPSLTRTWRFQVNQAIAGGGTGTATCQLLMYAIKQSLIGSGAWTDSAGAAAAAAGNFTVDYSCDSVTAGTKGDGVDRWAASTNLVWAAAGVAHSWIVLAQTGIGASFEVCIDLTNGNVEHAVILMSATGFTGGTTTNRPTAADEVALTNPAGTSLWGGTNAAGIASTLHVLNSTGGASSRVLVCRNGFVPVYWQFELPSEATSGWTDPAWGLVQGDSTAAPISSLPVFANLSNAANGYGRTSQIFGAYITAEADVLHGVLAINQTVPNDMGASWPIYDQGIYSIVPNSRGRLGKLVDSWWTCPTLVDSDTFPAGGTRNFCLFGDIVQPWNTSAPTFGGGVSTARDGDHVVKRAFASSQQLLPQNGGQDATTTTTGQIMYLMEAWDSVTGTQYNWLVATPDWAGTFYNGPNSPQNIAVAAIVPP